jgi:hypothetical protein
MCTALMCVAHPDPESGAFLTHAGIWCLFDTWIRDNYLQNQDLDTGSGSGINILDHIFESLETIFCV